MVKFWWDFREIFKKLQENFYKIIVKVYGGVVTRSYVKSFFKFG